MPASMADEGSSMTLPLCVDSEGLNGMEGGEWQVFELGKEKTASLLVMKFAYKYMPLYF